VRSQENKGSQSVNNSLRKQREKKLKNGQKRKAEMLKIAKKYSLKENEIRRNSLKFILKELI